MDLGSVKRARTHDDFALGVLIFQILMDGRHPFTGVWPVADDPPPITTWIKSGWFSYGGSAHVAGRRITPPPGAPPFDLLPDRVRAYFLRCFVAGHEAPRRRPSAQEWVTLLDPGRSSSEPIDRPPSAAGRAVNGSARTANRGVATAGRRLWIPEPLTTPGPFSGARPVSDRAIDAHTGRPVPVKRVGRLCASSDDLAALADIKPGFSVRVRFSDGRERRVWRDALGRLSCAGGWLQPNGHLVDSPPPPDRREPGPPASPALSSAPWKASGTQAAGHRRRAPSAPAGAQRKPTKQEDETALTYYEALRAAARKVGEMREMRERHAAHSAPATGRRPQSADDEAYDFRELWEQRTTAESPAPRRPARSATSAQKHQVPPAPKLGFFARFEWESAAAVLFLFGAAAVIIVALLT